MSRINQLNRVRTIVMIAVATFMFSAITWQAVSAEFATILFSEDFETEGNGSRYTVSELCNDGGDYFARTDGNDVSGTYNNPNGSVFFAAQDTDGAPCTMSTESITFSAVSLAENTHFAFTGLFAEDDDDSNQDWDADSSVVVYASVDGATEIPVLCFAAKGGTNTEPAQDTNCDGTGDGVALTDTFAQFFGCFEATGDNMVLRIVVANLDSGDEDIAFDLLELEGAIEEPTICSVVPNVPPAVSTTSPTDDATLVSITTNIVITFSESITLTGGITVSNGITNVMTTVVGNTADTLALTFDPTNNLTPTTDYTVIVPANAVVDSAGEGMSADHSFNFRTETNNNCNSTLVINELDADTADEASEFVELYDGGAGNTSLSECVLVFFNGNGDVAYEAFDLDGLTTDVNGYFVLGDSNISPTPNLTFTFGITTSSQIQNGSDAVALYSADAADFPDGTPPTVNKLIGALVYGRSSDDTGLLTALGESTQYSEDALDDKDNHSIQRVQTGSPPPTRDNDQTYTVGTPSPAMLNTVVPTAIALVGAAIGSSTTWAVLFSIMTLLTLTFWLKQRDA